MSNFAIITDSSCDLPASLVEELGIRVVPLSFLMEDKSYFNYYDNRDMSPEEFYEKLAAGSMPTTNAVNVGQATEAMEDYLKQGMDVLALGFSSALSTTYNSFAIAADDLKEQYPQRKILTVDTLSASVGHGLLVCQAAMMARDQRFYYCDEHFSYIQSDLEKRIFGIMADRLGPNDQLIFTTHNTDMLDLNLPKHAFAFLRKRCENGSFRVSMVSASDILKRNTDSVRCAVENDVFASLPDDSLLDALEAEDDA